MTATPAKSGPHAMHMPDSAADKVHLHHLTEHKQLQPIEQAKQSSEQNGPPSLDAMSATVRRPGAPPLPTVARFGSTYVAGALRPGADFVAVAPAAAWQQTAIKGPSMMRGDVEGGGPPTVPTLKSMAAHILLWESSFS